MEQPALTSSKSGGQERWKTLSFWFSHYLAENMSSSRKKPKTILPYKKGDKENLKI